MHHEGRIRQVAHSYGLCEATVWVLLEGIAAKGEASFLQNVLYRANRCRNNIVRCHNAGSDSQLEGYCPTLQCEATVNFRLLELTLNHNVIYAEHI